MVCAIAPLKLPCLTLLGLSVALQGRANAQIIPDGTLGPESSQLIDISAVEQLIRGGALRDENLFHSFEQFSIGEGGQVTFDNPAAVQRVFSRVTGDLPSEISGTLSSTGTADVYFLNPNGIVFGPDARLDVGGSCVASTADAFEFAGVGAYSAQNPKVPSSLLTIMPSALQFGQVLPEEIVVQSIADGVGLQVPNGESLVLLGGDVSIDGGYLTAYGGRIEVGAVAGAGTVGLAPGGGLTIGEGLARGDVVFTGGAFVDVQLTDNGDIGVTARNIDVVNSALLAGIFGSSSTAASQAGDLALNAAERVQIDGGFVLNVIFPGTSGGTAGDIAITAPVLEVLNGGEVAANTSGVGNAGQVVVDARDEVTVDGGGSFIASVVNPGATGNSGGISITTGNLSILNGAQVIASTRGVGNAGQVVVNARGEVTVDGEFSFISNQVNPGATGNSGGVSITTGNLSVLNNAQVGAATFSQGNAGPVVVNATGQVTVDGELSGIGSQVEPGATGDSGGVAITTGNLLVRNAAAVSASTFGTGNAGPVAVNARGEVTVDGRESFITSQVNLATGDSGGVSISAARLSVLNEAEVNALTFGDGDAGPIKIVTNEVILSTPGSVISARTDTSGTGGDIRLSSPGSLTISGPGTIRVDTRSTGPAGSIEVASQQLRLIDGVTLLASTAGEQSGGDITFNIADTLDIDGSTVTSSTETGSTGDGGNVTINAPITQLRNNAGIAVSSDGTGRGGQIAVTGDQLALINNSRVSANTQSSDGGNITLDLQQILALQGNSGISTNAGTAEAGGDGGDITINTRFIATDPRENSDITANAFNGDGGNVNITATGGIFGIAPRPVQTPLSDITASSRNGVSGTITVESPDVDPNQDAAELPTDPITSEVAQSCREAYVQTGSEFVVTGRGGLPQGPLDPATTTLWQDALPIEGNAQAVPEVTVPEMTAPEAEGDPATNSDVTTPPHLVEIQGWIKDEHGQIVLVADDPQPVTVGQLVACQG
ncbi:MAG: filamentous hemagglutinin N-terminal domain-containing protein [Cyanobacteria bacterium P01_A01_bin.105]